jgi:hypothetical protein
MGRFPDRGEHVVTDVAFVAAPQFRVHRDQRLRFPEGKCIVT